MLLERASWDEITELEPIQQWCAYYLWDRFKWADFKRMHVLASAALGDKDAASEASMEIAELLFPQVAQQRTDFVQDSMHTLSSLKGVSFRIRRADGR